MATTAGGEKVPVILLWMLPGYVVAWKLMKRAEATIAPSGRRRMTARTS